MAESAIYCFLSAQKPPSFRRCPLKPVVLVGTASRAVRPPPTHTTIGRAGGCDPGPNFCLGTRDLSFQNWKLGSCPGSPGSGVPGCSTPASPVCERLKSWFCESSPEPSFCHRQPESWPRPLSTHIPLRKPRTSHVLPGGSCLCQIPAARQWGWVGGLLQGGAQGLTFVWVTYWSSRQHHNNGKPSII